ncbi:MAG: hypothetical protein IJS08_14415 [Victivallales bacterium]|nr:hypothetical protein [Victivallales bacterium]
MWNYYYNFDEERQLAEWKALSLEKDGSVRLCCEFASEEEIDKILLWNKKLPAFRNECEVLEVNGNAVEKDNGFYIGRFIQRSGLRIHLHPGKNRIEVRLLPGNEGYGKFRMQLIDIQEKLVNREYFQLRKTMLSETYKEEHDISILGMKPGAGHRHYPGRFGFVKATGLLDCSMHAFGKVSKMYLCGDPKTKVPWAWGYSLIQEKETEGNGASLEEYQVNPLAIRWRRKHTEYLCSTAFPGIVTECVGMAYLKVSELTFAGNYQYVLSAGELASTGRFSGNLQENWLLLFGSTEYPDVPLLIIFDKRPGCVEFIRNGENRLCEVRLYGCTRICTMTPFGFEPLGPKCPEDEAFLADAERRCRFWARASLAIPVTCREYYRNDYAKQSVHIVQKFDYMEYEDEWGTERLHLAPLPPVWGIVADGALPAGTMDFHFPTKYGPLTGFIGRNCEYTIAMLYPYRRFPLNEDGSCAEKLLSHDLDAYFDFERRFADDARSFAYPGAALEGYAFTGTMFNFMPRARRDFLAKKLSERMRVACVPDGKYRLLLTDWMHLFKANPDREASEAYFKGETIGSMDMQNLYTRTEPFTGASYYVCYLNCSLLFSGAFKDGSQEELGAYPEPLIEIDWGIGAYFYMLYLSALISGDYSAIRDNWDVLKRIFAYFEIFHDWACMGAGYSEKACTWVEGVSFGAFTAFENMARAVGDLEAAEHTAYLAAKFLVLDKARFFAGPYFAGLYHQQPWYGNLFFQEEYSLCCNFQSVPKASSLSPRERVRKNGLHSLLTEGIYPELFNAFRKTSPKLHRMTMNRYRCAYRGGFDADKPAAGRLQADFSYLLVNDAVDSQIPPERTLQLLQRAKSCGRLIQQWHDVHRFENNTPEDYLESQINAWLQMRRHPLCLEHWEDLRIISALWNNDSKMAQIEIELTGERPLLRCHCRKRPTSCQLNGMSFSAEAYHKGTLVFRPGASGILQIQFR